ncbi:MAG TPA: ATP-binding cassette domain-containing protein [Candidatus Methylacidiphilales bacterium]
MPPIIEVKDLTKVYRTYHKEPGFGGAIRGLFKRRFEETRAADAVTFSIEEGELVGFLGPNGAGKTTVLKMLSGLLHPTSGEARILGFRPWERKDAFRRRFALVMGQKNQLWWDLPALESLHLNRAIYGLDPARSQRVLDELVEWLGVKDKLHVMVRELSLGERMKFEIVAALLHEPKVLFLDEPTIGLDVVSHQKVRDFLGAYAREKRVTTVLTSHYMRDIEELCRRVLIIDHGKLFYDGELSGITDRFASHKIVGLRWNGEAQFQAVAPDLSAYGEELEREGGQIRLRVARAELTSLVPRLLGDLRPDDITIEEVPVEEVIRRVFTDAAVR